ncbi:MAG: DUF4139 domain-containing protein [Rhodomicrobiaceae bacterium]
MRTIIAASLAVSMATSAMAEELPLRRVVLSTAGLAQFTHSGEVQPGSSIDLSVRLGQVDDLLKSLTIFDAQSAIGAVSLPGKAPLAELFRDLPFSADALESLPALLNALIGSEVEIDGSVSATGRLLKLTEETAQLPDNGGQTTRHRLTLMTEGGMVQAVLEELSSVRFTDPETQAQIDKALAGVAANRAKERRTLSINMLGDAARQVGFSYVVAAPVWKTAYRLVLPQDEEGKARLQGWAVVENLTGNDWTDVELSLVSGNPVALKQPLYTAFYSDRPEIPVTSAQRIVPRTDDAEDFPMEPAPAPMAEAAPGRPGMDRARRSMAKASDGVMSMYAGDAAAEIAEADAPQQLGGAALAAEAEEAATQISYRFPEIVTLTNGSTMMVPFVDREISAVRSWLYQPETNARHPLASIKLENDTETALSAGIITAFERSGDERTNFVGDAQLPLTGKGASKFVTFALDAKTDIRRTDKGVTQTQLGKAVDGVLTLTTKAVRVLDYEITPPAEEDRTVVIDEARNDGWKPSGEAANVELTASRIRYTVETPRGKTTNATLRLERTGEQIIRLVSLDPRSLYATLRGLENTSPELKQAIADLGAIVTAMNNADRQRNKLESETASIAQDQERIRKNFQTVGQGSDLGRRYLDTLRAQEDRLAEIRKEIEELDATIAAKQKEASDIARSLTL